MIIFISAFAFILYFLPWLVAAMRQNRNTTAIAIFNFLLGWTGLGWILALIWAFTK